MITDFETIKTIIIELNNSESISSSLGNAGYVNTAEVDRVNDELMGVDVSVNHAHNSGSVDVSVNHANNNGSVELLNQEVATHDDVPSLIEGEMLKTPHGGHVTPTSGAAPSPNLFDVQMDEVPVFSCRSVMQHLRQASAARKLRDDTTKSRLSGESAGRRSQGRRSRVVEFTTRNDRPTTVYGVKVRSEPLLGDESAVPKPEVARRHVANDASCTQSDLCLTGRDGSTVMAGDRDTAIKRMLSLAEDCSEVISDFGCSMRSEIGVAASLATGAASLATDNDSLDADNRSLVTRSGSSAHGRVSQPTGSKSITSIIADICDSYISESDFATSNSTDLIGTSRTTASEEETSLTSGAADNQHRNDLHSQWDFLSDYHRSLHVQQEEQLSRWNDEVEDRWAIDPNYHIVNGEAQLIRREESTRTVVWADHARDDASVTPTAMSITPTATHEVYDRTFTCARSRHSSSEADNEVLVIYK